MSLLTNWGYTLTGVNQLPDMLTVEEFNTFTANRYSGDVRISNEISASCSAIREYCGWHLYPSAACELNIRMNDRRVAYIGPDLLIQLPAKFVTEVDSVAINDVECENFSFETNGILRVYDVNFAGLKRYTPIVVTYTAGMSSSMMMGVQETVAHCVTHAAASSNGITSEAAGGVSITYNAGWINNARATSLPDSIKEALAPYKVQGVF